MTHISKYSILLFRQNLLTKFIFEIHSGTNLHRNWDVPFSCLSNNNRKIKKILNIIANYKTCCVI